MLGLDDDLHGSGRYGWIQNPQAVEVVLKSLDKPLFFTAAPGLISSLDQGKDIYLYDIFRKVNNGKDAPKGPQGIGDCVSWGWSNFVNYLQCVPILDKLATIDRRMAAQVIFAEPKEWDLGVQEALIEMKLEAKYEFQEISSESIYALSRVEIGGQHNSYQDGSVGAWAAKAVSTMGVLSRPDLKAAGLSPEYDPRRAKDWGAKGLPDALEPIARQHLVKTVSQVKSFEEAAAAIQNLQGVPVCSNQGFTMTRDNQGFCSPKGRWDHCMLFIAVRFDRPGLCCSQSWGPNTPNGPVDKGQPDNTFWVDAKVVDKMLSQEDSFTGNNFEEYIKRDYVDWSH